MKKRMKDIDTTGGFSLVEMLIVMAIIAVITGIAIPVYSRYLDNARLATSIALLDTIRTEIETYRNDHNAYPADIRFSDFTDPDGNRIVNTVPAENFKKEMHSWVKYTVNDASYLLIAKAIDNKFTTLTLTPTGIAHE